MKFRVLSRKTASDKDYVAYHIKEPHIWISITGTDESGGDPNFPRLPEDDKRKALLQIAFDDIDEHHDGYTLFSESHAQKIKSFVQDNKERIGLIVVNCDAGISRSSATAMALSLWLNGDDSELCENTRFVPNIHVKQTLIKVLHG